jgi:hypothetical protein
MDQKINNWLESVLATSSWLEYDDLHITAVDQSYNQKREEWILLGLMIMQKSNVLLKKINRSNDFFCALGLSLRSTKNEKGQDFFNLSQLNAKLDTSPPSVYLLKKNWDEWLETIQKSKQINLEDTDTDLICYLFEKEDKIDNTFYRSIFILERDSHLPQASSLRDEAS